ncbi:MAG: hspA [Bacteroidota bacterium]|nr:hspA [Bacteroidota bacterium]
MKSSDQILLTAKNKNMRTLVKAQCGIPATNRYFFDDIFGKEFFNYQPNAFKTAPLVNVKENDKEFLLEVSAPGLQKEDFKLQVEDGVLSISAEVKTQNESDENTKFTRREFSYQSFRKSFTLNKENVDTETIVAKYENGILNVSIPKKVKTEEENKAKTISIL